MILPLSDQPNPGGIPFVNYGLIGLNVLLFLLLTVPLSLQAPDPADPALGEYLRVVSRYAGHAPDLQRAVLARISAYDLFVFRHGFRPAHPDPFDLFTSMFLHAGWLHLFGNMLFLWIYGDNVEYRLGRLGYLAAYLGTGVAATLVHSMLQPGSELPTVGASGAISGALGFYFVWFPRNKVRVLLFLFPFLSQIVLMPARWVLGIYLVLDNLLPLVLVPAGGGGVAHGAHIGGFVAGTGAAWLIDRWGRVRRPAPARRRGPIPSGTVPAAPPAAVDSIAAAVRTGNLAAAADAYFRLPRDAARRTVSSADLLRMAEAARDAGPSEAALFLYQRLLADYPRAPERARAHLGAGLLQFYARRQPTAAYQHFLAALDADPPGDVAVRARQEIERIQHLQKLRLRRWER